MHQPDLGISALARQVGIPAGTLRNWERRYGFPAPTRTDGGHRLYDRAVLERLRLVAELLERGHRPSQVVPADVPSLRALLATEGTVRPEAPWLDYCREGEAGRLGQGLGAAHARLGAERWITEVVAPFVEEVGAAWARGELSIGAEHLASEVVRSELMATWRPLVAVANGWHVVLATLPGERHDLGLHMVAVIAGLRGWRVTFLGADTPLDDIVRFGRDADVVLLSCSAAADRERTVGQLAELRERLGDVTLLVGGAGAPGGSASLADLLSWEPS